MRIRAVKSSEESGKLRAFFNQIINCPYFSFFKEKLFIYEDNQVELFIRY